MAKLRKKVTVTKKVTIYKKLTFNDIGIEMFTDGSIKITEIGQVYTTHVTTLDKAAVTDICNMIINFYLTEIESKS